MPIEFSGAAYRLGHSIVRPSYALNAEVGVGENRIPIFSQETDRRKNLNGFGSIPDNWGIDWAFFLPGLQTEAPDKFQIPQPSYRMDAILVDPLSKLPEFQGQTPPIVANLAFRNLSRGSMLRLPTGEQVAETLGIKPLPREVLWSAGSKVVNGVPEELQDFATKRAKVFRGPHPCIRREDATVVLCAAGSGIFRRRPRSARCGAGPGGTAPRPRGQSHRCRDVPRSAVVRQRFVSEAASSVRARATL